MIKKESASKNTFSPLSGSGRYLRKFAAFLSKIGSLTEGLFFSNQTPQFPPVFILGPPRSGSTLFFQCFCHCFKMAYPNRLVRSLWFAPAFATWIAYRFFPPYSSDFKSQYGLSSGISSPFSLTMLNLFLDRDGYVGPEDVDPSDTLHISRVFGRIEKIMGRPLVSKNQRYNQWTRFLAKAFPNAIFLVMTRKPLGLSLSLLRARLEVSGSFSSWYLVHPLSFRGEEGASPEREVVWQLLGIMDDLREDMIKIGPERFAVIEYEQFCKAPHEYMEKLASYLEARGVPMAWREGQRLPGSFNTISSRSDKLTAQQVNNVEEAIGEIFPENKLPALPCVTIGSATEAKATAHNDIPLSEDEAQ